MTAPLVKQYLIDRYFDSLPYTVCSDDIDICGSLGRSGYLTLAAYCCNGSILAQVSELSAIALRKQFLGCLNLFGGCLDGRGLALLQGDAHLAEGDQPKR